MIAEVNPRAARNSANTNVSEDEKKRRDVVWELFTAELNYLVDHLLVMSNVRIFTQNQNRLKKWNLTFPQVFLEPLKESQCEGFVLDMEPVKIFANLEDLCKVSAIVFYY